MKYKGACHCKKVTYEVEMGMEGLISCNCSYCSIKGLILGFTPKTSFTILTGEDNLMMYKFNKHVLDHMFCKDCGVQAFSFGVGPDGVMTAAINVRTIDGIDISSLTINPFNGKDR